jgi:hypothetical protein
MPSNTNAEGLTAEAAVDRIEAAIHPRASDRRLHSRGAVYDAKFVPGRSRAAPLPRICAAKPQR